MRPEPHEYTVVLKNNIPDRLIGVAMTDLFGFDPAFITDKNVLKIQWQAFYYILEAQSANKLFEFRTATNFIINKRIEDEDFFNLIHIHLLTAIEGFNWHFERNNSFLTMGKSFTPVSTITQIEPPVRAAYSAVSILP